MGNPWKACTYNPNKYSSALHQLKSLKNPFSVDPKLSYMYQKTFFHRSRENHVKPMEMIKPPHNKNWY